MNFASRLIGKERGRREACDPIETTISYIILMVVPCVYHLHSREKRTKNILCRCTTCNLESRVCHPKTTRDWGEKLLPKCPLRLFTTWYSYYIAATHTTKVWTNTLTRHRSYFCVVFGDVDYKEIPLALPQWPPGFRGGL